MGTLSPWSLLACNDHHLDRSSKRIANTLIPFLMLSAVLLINKQSLYD